MKPLNLVIPVFVAVAALCLVFMLSYRRIDNRNKTTTNGDDHAPQPDQGQEFVLGQEMADAVSAEKRRLESNVIGKSPLPPVEYDRWQGETSLLDPVPVPLDSQLREVCAQFKKASPDERQRMRRSISLDEFYTLLTFASRSAVFALRTKDESIVTDGLAAVAMIECERIDFRDGIMALGLLHHAATRLDLNPKSLFADAARMAEPKMASSFIDFTERPREDRDLEAWGYDEFESSHGTGFIGRGYDPYAPTIDLKRIAVDISRIVDADKYVTGQIEYATELPDVWLQSNDNKNLQSALESVRGGATISADLRPNVHPAHASQQFTIFLVETASDANSLTLHELSKRKSRLGHSMLGVRSGRLFCLVVARSFMDGAAAYESTESLQRFSDGIQRILYQYSEQ
ncbi:MAG: hypothetical protein H7062_15745 [Candidatus Saccharimonas sp.]|nr:hypothetical protein [Planctomycetaceae bacterium]